MWKVTFFLIETLRLRRFYASSASLLYEAGHGEEFPGSLAAEVLKREILVKCRTVERLHQRAVSMAKHIDETAAVDAGITPNHPPLLEAALNEQKVIFAIPREHTRKVLAYRHAPRLAGHQLQIDAQFRVRMNVNEELVGFTLSLSFGRVFTKSTGKRLVAVLQIVVQDFSYEARAVLFFRPCAGIIVFLHITSGSQIELYCPRQWGGKAQFCYQKPEM